MTKEEALKRVFAIRKDIDACDDADALVAVRDREDPFLLTLQPVVRQKIYDGFTDRFKALGAA